MPRVAGSSYSEVHIGEQDEADAVELDRQRPFRILLAGDFSGRSWRENPPASFTPHRIDRDNFDDVLGKLKNLWWAQGSRVGLQNETGLT